MSGALIVAANGGRRSPLDAPLPEQRGLGWIASLSALALHGGLVALLVTGRRESPPTASPAIAVTRLVEVDLQPQPSAAAWPPVPPPPQAAAPAKPVARTAKPKASEPPAPPAPAQAGKVFSAPDEVVDFGNSIVSGAGARRVGAVSANAGMAQQATREASADGSVVGVPGGTGDANVDRSRPPGLGGAALWDCAFPIEADDAGVDHALVTLRVDIAADGGVVRAEASSDPGHGFGREAEHCARHKTWKPALDRAGRPIAGIATVRVRFDR